MGENESRAALTDRPVVVYVAGSGRSGSTLLERALGAVPGYVNVGELIDLPRRVAPGAELCGCGVPFPDCPFWAVIGKRGFDDWSPTWLATMEELQGAVARQRHLPKLLRGGSGGRFAEQVREYGEHYASLYGQVALESGARHVVDASKWPSQALALFRGGIDVRVVHLVRDVRGVAHSLNRADIARPHALAAPDLMFSESPATSAGRWLATQTEVDLLARVGVPVAHLRYGDLVEAPREAVHSVLAQLGTPVPDGGLDHLGPDHLVLGPSHGLSGNPSRFVHGEVRLRPDDRWRTQMRRRDQLLTVGIALPQLRYLNRPLRPVSSSHPAPERAPEAAATAGAALPTVSVVLPTHGRPELLRAALESVVAQRYEGSLECLVVHDQEEADTSLLDYSAPGRTIRVLTNQRTPGLAGARNTGVAASTGELIASCDDDDLWHPTKLAKQVRALQDDPTLLMVGSGLRLLLPRGRVQEWPGRRGRITYARLLRNRVKELHSSTLLMHRDAFAKAGGYDETLPRGYAEDYDFVLRVARVGRIAAVREPLADIRKDGGSYYAGRASRTAEALEVFLAKHPDITRSRRGHARVLGQMAVARASTGEHGLARRYLVRGVSRWPLSPHPYVAALQLATGSSPERIAKVARVFKRGMA